ncbi:Rieske 2Fe-2S domain-containing protein [Pseudomonas sp. LRF_L74]|uniref:Rieske 2Fe-2S domain-containing protein n=1 Tax=Pseudomonas sp. LRF_L74 TaxID=3369422 RepID=UPI003F6269D1
MLQTTPRAPRARNQAMADHRTPLIRNCWYVAALSDEVDRNLLERRLLDTSVVMYRTQAGAPVILNNRCAHRSFPLSRGYLNGDEVVCGYHGMAYAASGQCVGMPALPNAPSNACVASYPVIERKPFIWVWMGDREKALPELVPDTHWLDHAQWRTISGGFNFHSNYVAMHENLLDQTHFSILHAKTGIGTPAYVRSDLDVRAEGDRVIILRALKNSPPPPVYAVPMKLEGRNVDRFSDARFESPAIHIAHAKIVNLEPREDEALEYRVNITHAFTPETQNTLHYWWFNSRDFHHTDAEIDRYVLDSHYAAYQEDVDALTWIQQLLDREPGAVEELSFAPDRPGILCRRTLLRLSQLEHGIPVQTQ